MACAHKAQRHGKPCPTRRVQEDGDGDRGGAPELTGTQPRHGMTYYCLNLFTLDWEPFLFYWDYWLVTTVLEIRDFTLYFGKRLLVAYF